MLGIAAMIGISGFLWWSSKKRPKFGYGPRMPPPPMAPPPIRHSPMNEIHQPHGLAAQKTLADTDPFGYGPGFGRRNAAHAWQYGHSCQ